MALVKCRECGKEISDKAKICVNCGCPIENNKNNTKKSHKKRQKKKINSINILYIVIAILVLSIIVSIIKQEKEYQDKVDEYNERLENSNSSTNSSTNNSKNENNNKTPKERFDDVIMKHGYTKNSDTLYYFNYGNSGNTMYDEIDLKKGLYSSYSSTGGLSILYEYYFKERKIELDFNYMGYSSKITWDLKTEKWKCSSTMNNWCNENGQDYVDNEMSNKMSEFDALLDEADITINDL